MICLCPTATCCLLASISQNNFGTGANIQLTVTPAYQCFAQQFQTPRHLLTPGLLQLFVFVAAAAAAAAKTLDLHLTLLLLLLLDQRTSGLGPSAALSAGHTQQQIPSALLLLLKPLLLLFLLLLLL